MAYAADFALSTNVAFLNQVQMSMAKAAVSISNEARTLHATVDEKRNKLAFLVLTNPTVYISQFAIAAIEAAGLSGTPTDAQVDSAITSVWNAIAGVTPIDLVA
jgi:hypothetical protein